MSGKAWHQPTRRKGAVTVLIVLFLFVFLALAAMAVDLGYLGMARSQMQRAADAAAMAAVWEYAVQAWEQGDTMAVRGQAFSHANSVAQDNAICKTSPSLASADVKWGYLADFTNRNETLDTGVPLERTNAVEVLLRRTDTLNGRVPSFFARVLGVPGFSSTVTATAGMLRNIQGFTVPSDGSDLGFIPITLDEPTWDDLLAGGGTDQWSFDPTTKAISAGADGIREVNLYPLGSGPPGNRGTLDIGSSGNSTSDISRQILHGLSPSDLAYHGGSLQLDHNGELDLNGDTGISAGIKDELTAIKGKPRVIPLFREVQGPGNNAQYTIVRFVGVRIMHVKLTGSMSSKQVIIQPAPIVVKGAVPSTENSQQSNYVFSPVMLVR
jgi:Flp pilus assembly protein TadG